MDTPMPSSAGGRSGPAIPPGRGVELDNSIFINELQIFSRKLPTILSAVPERISLALRGL